MGFFRKKASRALSAGQGESTDSPMFGTFVDPAMIRAIDETGIRSWARQQRGRIADATKDNYPEAWRAGRELAERRYVERLRDVKQSHAKTLRLRWPYRRALGRPTQSLWPCDSQSIRAI